MKIERKLGKKEIRILDKQLALLGKGARGMSRFLIIYVSIALVIGTFFYFRMEEQTLRYLLIAVAAAYIGIGAWVYVEAFIRRKRQRKSIRILKGGFVTEVTVKSEIFCLLPEDEDEGCYYLYQIDDEHVFSFGGQEFYPTKNFPNNDFQIIIGRNQSGEIIFLEKYIYGQKIKPAFKIKGNKKWQLLNKEGYPDPEEFSIQKGKIGDYLDSIH